MESPVELHHKKCLVNWGNTTGGETGLCNIRVFTGRLRGT